MPDQPRIFRPGATLGALSPFFLTTALCLVLGDKDIPPAGESFPFSNFPMYSRFSDQTYYVYVADGNGSPIPVETVTYHRTAKIKKIYHTELTEIGQALDKRLRELTPVERQPAGRHTLEWLVKSTGETKPQLLAYGALQLYQVDVVSEDGHATEREPTLVGSLELNATP
jgi:hypothetical protein